MSDFYSRETEYQALRAFVKVAVNPKSHRENLLASAIDEVLTPRQNQIVKLYYLKQIPMKQIASDLGVSVSTISRTLKRARVRLHRCLKYAGHTLFDNDDF